MKRKTRDYLILITITLVMVFTTTLFSNTFGSNTDWLNQHTVIPEYFRQMFYKTGRLIPDLAFNYGAGQNIFNLSYYGLLSPVIIPSYFLPFMDMTLYMTIVDILLVIISGILFYKWLKNNGYNDDVTLISSILFITAGPLIFHMHRHIMFVSYMPFLIMSLIGVDRLIKYDKKTVLIAGIFLMIMTSYYYSVCGIIVIFIYYIYKYLESGQKHIIKDSIKFIFYIFIAIFMSSVLILPTFHTLISGRTSSEKITMYRLFIPNLNIHKLFCGTYSIGLSIIGFVSLVYLFFTKKKNNIITASLISVVLFLPIFMFILNGGLYLKEKCFIPFLPLIAYFVAFFLNDLFSNKIDTKKFSCVLFITMLITYFFNMNKPCYLMFIALILLLFMYSKNSKKLFIILLISVSVGTLVIENLYEDNVSIEKYNEIFNKEMENTIKNVLSEDNTFYRSNNLYYPTKTINKIYKYNYNTTNMYSSTYNRNYLRFVKNTFRTNSRDYNHFMVSAQNNILFNTYMGVKYLYSTYDPGVGYYEYKGMYRNDNVFPIVYASNHFMKEELFNKLRYPFIEEALLNNVITKENKNTVDSNIEKIDLNYEIVSNKGVDIIKNDNGYILKVKDKGYLDIKIDELNNKLLFISLTGLKPNNCKEDNISMKINNVENILTCKTWPYPNKNNIFRFAISDKKINNLKIELTKGNYNIDTISTYILDYNYVKDSLNNITMFDDLKYDNGVIKGTIKIKEPSYLVTSIPYDSGYTVKLNNVITDYEMINKGFIGVPIDKGEYKVEISYNSPWLKEGKIITSLGIILFVIVFSNEKDKIKK